jgi:hypothetical protein
VASAGIQFGARISAAMAKRFQKWVARRWTSGSEKRKTIGAASIA